MQHIQIQLKLSFTQQMLPLARAQATNKSFHPHTFKRQASPGTHSHSASVCARHNCLLGSRPIATVFQHHRRSSINSTGTKAKSIQWRTVLGGVTARSRPSNGKRARRRTYISELSTGQSTGTEKHGRLSHSPGQGKRRSVEMNFRHDIIRDGCGCAFELKVNSLYKKRNRSTSFF